MTPSTTVSRMLEVNGTSLFTLTQGPAGAPWVVLLNSLASDTSMWNAQADALSSTYRVLRLDWRGHGRSHAAAPPYGMQLLADDVIEILGLLHVERPHLAGVSLGGMLAMHLVLRSGLVVASLSVCNASARTPPAASDQWGEVARLVRAHGVEAVLQTTLARWFTPGYIEAHPDHANAVRQMIEGTSTNGYVGCVEAIRGFDLLADLQRIASPTQFIAGESDPAATPEIMRAMRSHLAGSGFHVITGAAHLPALERPQEMTRLLQDFMALHA